MYGVANGVIILLSIPFLKYNTAYGDIAWEKSTIRQYLNNESYNTFSEEEKAMIKETDVVCGINSKLCNIRWQQ